MAPAMIIPQGPYAEDLRLWPMYLTSERFLALSLSSFSAAMRVLGSGADHYERNIAVLEFVMRMPTKH
jgi:hypothetical protein